jgi:hypothetical protein
MIVWRWIKACVKWWLVTFVICDDWRVAARIAVALLATWGLVEADVLAWSLMPLAVLYTTVRSLHRAIVLER